MSAYAAARTRLDDVLPPNRLRQFALAFPLDWNHERPFRLPTVSRGLGPYYIDWDPGCGTYGEDWIVLPRDPYGVLLTTGRKNVYHPIRIAQYALYAHQAFVRTGDAKMRDAFLAQARWLRDRQVLRGGVEGCYPFPFPWEKYGAAAGWISAMAQGEAISALLRADELAGGFADAALRAAMPFRRGIEDGGVVWRNGQGDVFCEEVAAEPAAHILNGALFALFGLYDLHHTRPQPWVGKLFEELTATLRRRLELFDSGAWSYYSLLVGRGGRRHVASLRYHAFAIAQLRVLAAMTGDSYFGEIAQRWSDYRRNLRSRAWVVAHEVAAVTAQALTGADTVARGSHALL